MRTNQSSSLGHRVPLIGCSAVTQHQNLETSGTLKVSSPRHPAKKSILDSGELRDLRPRVHGQE